MARISSTEHVKKKVCSTLSLGYGKHKPTDTFFFDQNMVDNALDILVEAFSINGR